MDGLVEKLGLILKQIEQKIPDSFDLSKSAAVLILLVNHEGNWDILYTRRTNGVKTHQGEVSFPGGAWEPGDSNLAKTALRETREEIGVAEERIKLLGEMDPHLTVYGYTVVPFVGILDSMSDLEINTEEVDRVFSIPLDWLLDRENYHTMDHELFGKMVKQVLHYKDYDGEHLWGLTARITQDLLGRI